MISVVIMWFFFSSIFSGCCITEKMSDNSEKVCISSSDALSEKCVICSEALGEDRQNVYKKGLETLIRVSEHRGDKELHDDLLEKSQTFPINNVYVHKIKRCRTEYTKDPESDLKRAKINAGELGHAAKKLRSLTGHL